MNYIESLRGTEGNGWVVRLLFGPYTDNKWYIPSFNFKAKRRRYMLVRYELDLDRYLPRREKYENRYVPWWDEVTYEELGKLIHFEKPSPKKRERLAKSRELFRAGQKVRRYFDDFPEAEDLYIDWCKKYCGVDRVRWNPGKRGLKYT